MRRLIVNADDFGLSAEVNRAVESAHARGLITAASLMVSERGAAEAADVARRRPSLGIGLHLALSSGRSTTGHPELTTRTGMFRRNSPLLGFRYFARRSLRAPLEAEIRAQIEKFESLGLRADHVDGHKDLHVHPTIFPMVVRLAKELKIPAVRLLEPAGGLSPLWIRSGRRQLRRAGLRTPDRVIGIRSDLSVLPDGTHELYVHLPADLDRLCRLQSEIRRLDIRLVTHRDLE